MLLKTMKCMTTIKYRMALSWGRHSIRHIKLPLSKGGSLLRGEVGCVRIGLDGIWKLEIL